MKIEQFLVARAQKTARATPGIIHSTTAIPSSASVTLNAPVSALGTRVVSHPTTGKVLRWARRARWAVERHERHRPGAVIEARRHRQRGMRADHRAAIGLRLLDRVLREEANLVEQTGLGNTVLLDQAAEMGGVLGTGLCDTDRAAGALALCLRASCTARQADCEPLRARCKLVSW